jgi:prepilin-type N-terminal cleavage/methylation domain-containing protein
MAAMRSRGGNAGFSLLEVMVASSVLAGAVVAAAQLFAVATASNADARTTSEATMLAWQKIEQLRSLAFTSDEAGQPITDVDADTAAEPPAAFGGAGLSPSPAGALDRDTDGYVDYLDGFGVPRAGGARAPRGVRYRRRWAIEADGPDRLILRVRVLPIGREVDAARVVALRARRLP